jgi:hypothetical protein
MEDPLETTAADEPVYDIHLRSRPPESLRTRFPRARVETVPAQTALLGRVSEPDQLDDLLDKVRSVGLVLADVHRLASTTQRDGAPSETYEVRVEGELGDRLLRYLRWPHYVVPEQTVVRIAAAPANLQRCLQSCTEAGAGIERISLVEPHPA